MKTSLKKNFQIKTLKTYLENKQYLGLYNLNKINVLKYLELKSTFRKYGFKIQIVNNKVLKKTIDLSFPKYLHLQNLPQGFSLLVVPVTNSKVDIISLRDLFKIIKKEKDILFLGGLFEGSLINTSFVSDILNLKDPLTIYLEILQSISYPSTSISITSQNIVISTLLCLEEKATEK